MVRGVFESARVRVSASSRSPAASRGPRLALAAVAAAYTAVLLTVTLRIGLGWDESVYASQVARGVPAAVFSAPRARGVPLLLAPVALLTPSVTAIRVYLSLLSGLALYASHLPWLRLRGGPAVPLAAALFGGLWLSLFYGNEAMPNPWVAYGAVAGTGLFRLAWRGRDEPGRGRGALAGTALAFAGAALVRPTDATWLALPLLAYGLARGRPAPALAVAAGTAAGWAEWCAEAVLHYGGPLTRLRAAGAENDTGLHLTILDHLRALDGPLLCRYGTPCGGYPLRHVAWLAALILLAALGLWAARGRAAVTGPHPTGPHPTATAPRVTATAAASPPAAPRAAGGSLGV
ncbi:membrane protein, partial [Microbispora sp. ATCC PTA-5024]